MIQKFICTDGTVYAKATGSEATIDEVIEFLEQFRGMRFWNGATGDVAFRLDGNTICCDSHNYNLICAEETDNALPNILNDFFDSDEEYGKEKEWRKLYDDSTDDETSEYGELNDTHIDEEYSECDELDDDSIEDAASKYKNLKKVPLCFINKSFSDICDEQIGYCLSKIDSATKEIAYYEEALLVLQTSKRIILKSVGNFIPIDDEVPF